MIWSLFLGLVRYRSMTLRSLTKATFDTIETTASVLFIVTAASIFAWLLTVSNTAQILSDLILSLTGGRGLSGLAILYGILYDLTEPVLRPIRRLLPPLRVGAVALDLSPLIVFVLIALLRQVVSTS